MSANGENKKGNNIYVLFVRLRSLVAVLSAFTYLDCFVFPFLLMFCFLVFGKCCVEPDMLVLIARVLQLEG